MNLTFLSDPIVDHRNIRIVIVQVQTVVDIVNVLVHGTLTLMDYSIEIFSLIFSSGSARRHRRSRSPSGTSSSRRHHRHRHDSRSPVSNSKQNGSSDSRRKDKPIDNVPTTVEDDEETTRILESIQQSMKEDNTEKGQSSIPME